MAVVCSIVPESVAKYFPGRLPDQVSVDFPMFPLNAPGMPNPGPNFMDAAVKSGDCLPSPAWKKPDLVTFIAQRTGADEKETKKRRKDELAAEAWRLALPNSWLEVMYRAALYRSRFFHLKVRDSAGNEIDANFLSGHMWAPKIAKYGPQRADVMVIGKHPGRDEMARGYSFVGQGSDDLHRAMEDLQVNHEDWYVTNLIKHQNIDRAKDSTMPVDWTRNCLPLLHQELRIVQPKIVICLGAEASKAILGRNVKMTDTVGRIFESSVSLNRAAGEEPLTHNFKVVCAAHPARVAREPELYDKPDFLGALRLAVDLATGERVGIEETGLERVYAEQPAQLIAVIDQVLAECGSQLQIAIDGEWHGDFPWDANAYMRTIQFSHKPKFGAVVVLNYAGGKPNAALPSDFVVAQLRRLLMPTSDRSVRLIGHNLKADLVWIKHYGLNLLELFEAPDDWEKTQTEGGFDTLLATHAVSETGPFKLEVVASQHLGTPRYDVAKEQWLTAHCKEQKIKRDALLGYGDVPDEILWPYGAYDADVTRRLFDVFNGTPKSPGLLDLDRFGNCCREAFWVSQRATPIAYEIETTGIPVDQKEVERLTKAFAIAKSDLLMQLRTELNWPDFNPNSTQHRVEFLFGHQLTGKDQQRPQGAKSLGLTPIATTKGRPWDKATPDDSPSTDKTSVCTLAANNPTVKLYRDLNFVGHTLKTVLRPPNAPLPDAAPDDEAVYDKGLMSFVNKDGRVRTSIFPVETGRWSSSRPNLMNYSSKRDEDYSRILKAEFRPLRSLFMAPPGYVLIEGDFAGAELAVTGWLSRDPNLIEHARRMQLPEDHPDFYDIHSNIAVKSFNLTCKPTKKGLKEAKLGHLRIAAKRRIFGLFYGQGDAAALLQIWEEGGHSVTLPDVQRTTQGIHEMYPGIQSFFDTCKRRVTDPGWICNPFGRFRRFHQTTNQQRLAGLEREAQNAPIQSTVADAMSRALDNLYSWRKAHPNVKFDLLLQIHDAVLMAVPYEHAALILEEVIPECMTRLVPIWPCTLDGVPFGTKPERLSADKKVGLRWGESLTKAQAKAFGIPEKYAKD